MRLDSANHVCSLDPLKVVLVQALSAAFFFSPALNSLRARYLVGGELAVDRRAVRACGRRPLVGALLKVVRGPDWSELEGGCHLSRDTTAGIEQAGFVIETCERFPFRAASYLPPDPHILGIARRP